MEDSMDLVYKSSVLQGNKYEVFLSYSRDEDTQESFSSCLCSSLREAGISVLEDHISNEVLQSIIEGCKISIIIFSKHYASSERCLVELAKLMEFRRAYDHFVLPIFHGVLRSEVRNQEFSFGEAFRDLIQRISPTDDDVSRWRTALTEAGGIYGFDVSAWESMFDWESTFHRGLISENQSQAIQNIVEHVRFVMDIARIPFFSGGLVGVRSQVLEVMTMLHAHRSKDVVSIGIWGMPGIGKTTLARLIFEQIKNKFESTCFLENVSEFLEWEDRDFLQRKLLSAIGGTTNYTRMDSIDLGSHKKVLLVLDDVNAFTQLDAFRGILGLFGEGSRIIITTRDLRLLEDFEVDNIYTVKPLSDHESLELFSRTAFKQESPEGEFMELSRRVVAYTEGLPLALKLLGSSLCGKSLMEWESTLMKLCTDLPRDIYNILKLTFDSLSYKEQEIFINIVLFYIEEDKYAVMQKLDDHVVMQKWDDHVFDDASFVLGVLEGLCLVTIGKDNKLRVHNLLQLMGRQIIRETSQNELGDRGHRYDVFLSFRGEDIRATFTSHLCSALHSAGIIVFKDDVELLRGNHIKTELLRAIGSSKIAIIIFSREYAASKWCLEELSMIIEFHRSNDQVILPVFYNVDPSEIRNQTSSFGEAFNDLIKRISASEAKVSNWRTTLAKAGGIARIIILGSRDKSEDVKAVVERVRDILDKNFLFVAQHPVGVYNRVQEVITMLQNHQSEDVIMVGIWGMGGTGKTTVAKALYNEIGHTFESRSYLSMIRRVWHQEEGKVSLQNQLLSEICKTTKMLINSVESGKIILRDRLRRKKALVILDDVDKSAQLKALIGGRDWFKSGSTIIITTRNKRLLCEMDCGVYLMKNLNEAESIELFSWHAFKQESPKEDFTELSRDIVAYSVGLPLALEVLGNYLFGREAKEWKSVLEKPKKIPDDEIQKKLKISFDGLNDLEKEIFLDISCFFIGMDINDVTQILNGCGLFANIGIKTLVEQSLVTLNEKNKLGMHMLLRDMGREIIREQSQMELGGRSRLWFHEDARAVLLKHMGTEAIEGLSLKLSQNAQMHFQTEAFKMMKRLRLLRLDNVQIRGDYKYISKDLRWLCWHGFPLKHIPSNFYQKKLVAIDLSYSSLRQVWKRPLLLKRLKILNLSHSHYLVQTPDFSELPNLEKLILKDCSSLSMIHYSIGILDKLILLNLKDCIGLNSLPRSIYRLKCLKTVNLSGCVRIEKLEEDIEQMESMTSLIAPTIKQVPFSLVRLKSILHLSIGGYEGLSNHVIPSLYWPLVSPKNNPLRFILTYAGMPSSILWNMLNNIHDPSTIPSSERKPQSLWLEYGPEIPDSLCATNYMDISRLEKSLAQLLIQIGKNSQVFCTLSDKISQGLNLTKCSNDCVLPGDNYPHWLTFKGEGASVKFKVSPINGRDHLKGIAICCVYIPSGDLGNKAFESLITGLMITNYTKRTTLVYMEDKLNSLEEAEKEIISNLELDDQVEVKVIFGNRFTVKKIAVYLIFSESFDEQMEPSPFEATNLTGSKHESEEEEEALQSIRPTKTTGIWDESENVKYVVENVSEIWDKKDLFLAEHPVGVDNRVQEVITMLQNHQSKDVVMVGIWGMGGVGKSTIAKALYNEICHTFESRSYLSNIREVWDQEEGQVHLQNQLLSQICQTTKIKINNIESGIITLSDRLRHKKALVVLDDVDKSAQLNALVGSCGWFKPGSKIVITTRNQRLLHEIDCAVYLMKNLDEEESIKLFSWHAFKQESPREDFIELSRDIATYCGGIPLALEVLGSYLFAREVEEWKSASEKLKKIPNDRIDNKLKISFDGLDDLEKEIFLDISCFFIGMDRSDVTQILNGCGLFAIPGIKTLLERSLVTINEKNMLGMHDLLRDMGREIIRKRSEKTLGKRSRLWFHEDALAVLPEHRGTEHIEGLSLKLSQSEKMHFQTKAFKKMTRLRLLHLDNVQLKGDYKYISRELRWLCWHRLPLKYIPTNFDLQELVVIDLKYSSLRQVWKEPQLLESLKILNLSHSPYLVQTPDFSKLPNLEKLILKDCPSLSMIHHSIGLLHKLLVLDLEDCIGLRDLPRSIYRLKCLKTLILSGCKNLERLEEDIEQMEFLTANGIFDNSNCSHNKASSLFFS